MEQLAGRVAMVTGAGSGIGRGIAVALAAAGSHVIIADIDAAAARATAGQLVGTGVEVVPAECDVTDREAVEALASEAWAHFGHVAPAGALRRGRAGGAPGRHGPGSNGHRPGGRGGHPAGDFYSVTHPPVREIVAERAAEIMAAFDAQAPRYQGDGAIDTRAVMARSRTPAEGRS
jgi:NAD(P)-dependent dehydrogenase (short-subunit alcohol dehydrogenase family)